MRELLEKVVHCSIMKLNETSMNKLFDLTYMGVKLQIFNSQSPTDLFLITLNHLNGILEIVKNGIGFDCTEKCKKKF